LPKYAKDGVRQYKKRNIDWSKPDSEKNYRKIYYEENPRDPKVSLDQYYKNQKNILKRMKASREKDRLTVMNHYSDGKLECDCCGEQNYMFLTINHDEGRKKWNHPHSLNGHKLYRWLIKNNFPKGFSVKCFNCNIAEGLYGFCIHKKLDGKKVLPK